MPPPSPASLDTLLTGREDSNFVAAEGYVAAVGESGDALQLTIVEGIHTLVVYVADYGDLRGRLLDSRVASSKAFAARASTISAPTWIIGIPAHVVGAELEQCQQIPTSRRRRKMYCFTQEARYETYDREVDLDDLRMISHPGRPAGEDNGNWYGDIAIPANTAYLLLSEQCLARMATHLGDRAMAERRRARYNRGVAAMRRHMWDQDTGCFLSVRIQSLEKTVSPTVGGLTPLMANVPTRTQAARMAAVLATPAWATPLPIPTVARTDKQFKPDDFWRGDVWPAPNYQVARGLASYGHQDAAARIADTLVSNALKVGISERYDSLSGAPLGVKGLGMSAIVITMMLDGLTSRYELLCTGSH